MQCSDIDELTTAGTKDVLRDLVTRQFGILPEWLSNCFLFILGDQLTIDRIRKVVHYLRKGSSAHTKHLWARPVIQLWHMKWAWQKAIIRLHWSPKLEKGTYGLHYDCQRLGRKKYSPDKCEFYPTHHLLEDRFDTMVLEALRYVLR